MSRLWTFGIVWVALSTSSDAGPPVTPIRFRQVADDWGVRFRFETGSRDRHDLPEIMAGGLAVADFDGDGRLDLYLCNGGPIVERKPDGRPDPPCRLFLNRLPERFFDVTESAGAPGPRYAMGAAVGDYDRDGRLDLFVTGWGSQRLYRNLGGGRFEDTTVAAGVESSLWSTSAAFADLDGDGDMDLYVANYLDFDPAQAPFCAAPDGRRDYCGPEDFPAQPDRLYRNNGDGTFLDVSNQAGVDLPESRGLGVLIADLTGDHRPDIFVANDGTDCHLFENRGELRFAEVGASAGVARDGNGSAIAGMGTALGDIDGDSRPDLVVTNFFGRSTIGFQCLSTPPATYADASAKFGLSGATREVLGFGVALTDFDGDGRLDLVQANGHVLDRARLGTPFTMMPSLLRGNPDKQGVPFLPQPALGWFTRPILGRGLAVGDFNNDARPDLAIVALDAPAELLRNDSEGSNFRVLDVIDRFGQPAVGARVRVFAGGREFTRDVVAGGSYLSASESCVFLGLGDNRRIDRIEVDWPWGNTELRTKIPEGTRIRIVEAERMHKPK